MNFDKKGYKYPEKLKKFGIQHPCLRLLATKYEKEIPWQQFVKNETTLLAFSKTLVKNLHDKIDLSNKPEVSFYVNKTNVDLQNALNVDPDVNVSEKKALQECLDEKGEDAAIDLLVEMINSKKQVAYKKWWLLVNKKFKHNPSFTYLILKPIFDSTKKGKRRVLPKPSISTLRWLEIQIEKNRITPKDNLAKCYFQKFVQQGNFNIENGWQYISAKKDHATVLSASVQESGWCIASESMAKLYLKHFDFYILKKNYKPIVALRVDAKKKTIVECQGLHNKSPEKWFWDIHFFSKYLDLKLDHRIKSYNKSIQDTPQSIQNELWWDERLNLFPLAIQFYPTQLPKRKQILTPDMLSVCMNYTIIEKIKSVNNVILPYQTIVDTITNYASLFDQLSGYCKVEELGKIKELSLQNCLEKVEEMDISLAGIERLPDFIKTNASFLNALSKNIPEDFSLLLGRKTKENKEKKQLEQILPSSKNEPLELAIIRAANVILTNPSSDFSDRIFNSELKQHRQFKFLRAKAWVKAIEENPTFYFALPKDLRKKSFWQPETGLENKKMLEEWVTNVKQKPWLLTQQNTVPKSVRYHGAILHAYIEGWLPLLRENPLSIEHKIGKGYHQKKVHLALPALCVHSVFHAMVIGFQRKLTYHASMWRTASVQLRSIPAMQLAALLSTNNTASHGLLTGYLPTLYTSTPNPNIDDPLIYFIYLMLTGKSQDVSSMYYSTNVERDFGFQPLPKLSKEEKLILKKL